jgi:hypothetical protein
MSRSFLTNVNLNKNQLLNAAIQPLSQAPQNPAQGQIYFDTGISALRQWTGSAWIDYLSSADGNQFIESVGANLDVTSQNLTLGNKVVITDASQTLTNKTVADELTFNDGVGASSTIAADGNTLSVISAAGDVYIESTNADIVLNADGSVYKQSAAPGNELTTRGIVDSLIGDATVDGTTGNTVTDRIATAVSDLVDGAPALLDTLNELAAAINDDASFSTTITTSIGTKVSKSGDTMTGALVLSGDPTLALHAATKQYVDAEVSSAISGFKYAANNTSLTPTSGSVTWAVTHNLGSTDVLVQVRDIASKTLVEVDVEITDSNVVTLSWVAASTVAADSYRVVVVG